jgi:hypothetical protein
VRIAERVQVHVLRASTDREIDIAFASVAQSRIPALAMTADAFLITRREKVAAFAARDGVPAMYSFRDYAESAGRLLIPPVSLFPPFPHIPQSQPNAAWN